jgi:hypothetical protein
MRAPGRGEKGRVSPKVRHEILKWIGQVSLGSHRRFRGGTLKVIFFPCASVMAWGT